MTSSEIPTSGREQTMPRESAEALGSNPRTIGQEMAALLLEYFDPANVPVIANCEGEMRQRQQARRARLQELAHLELGTANG